MAETIVEAVLLEQFERVRALVAGKSPEEAKKLVNEADEFGDSPLHWAAQKKLVLFARFLVLHGANVNAKNNAGSTPLHKAVLSGSVAIIDFLFESGAHWVANDSGYTPFDYARADRDLFNKLLAYENTTVQDTMTIPFAKLALVIGKQGKQLDDLRLRTGASINVPRAASPEDTSDRVIQFIAKSQLHIDQAKKLISERLARAEDNPKDAKGNVASQAKFDGETFYAQFSRQISIPRNKLGRLFGKGGKTLEELQEKTDTKINVPPSSAKSDVITVVGEPNDVDKAIREILNLTKDQPNAISERKVKIPKEKHRMLIGKGGETIQRLRDTYSVQINIPPPNKDDDFVVFKGASADIDGAVYEVHTLLTQDRSQPREPGQGRGRGGPREGGRGGGERRQPREKTDEKSGDAAEKTEAATAAQAEGESRSQSSRGGRGGGRGGRGGKREDFEERPEPKKKAQQQAKAINLESFNDWPSF